MQVIFRRLLRTVALSQCGGQGGPGLGRRQRPQPPRTGMKRAFSVDMGVRTRHAAKSRLFRHASMGVSWLTTIHESLIAGLVWSLMRSAVRRPSPQRLRGDRYPRPGITRATAVRPPGDPLHLTRRIRLMRRKWAPIEYQNLRISHFFRAISPMRYFGMRLTIVRPAGNNSRPQAAGTSDLRGFRCARFVRQIGAESAPGAAR
jgi:hypothetical protein